MKRKLLSFLLALSMILTFMPAMAFADDETTSATFSISSTSTGDSSQSVFETANAELPFKSDGTAVVTAKASRLVGTANFAITAVETGDWEDASGTCAGQSNWRSVNKGDVFTFALNPDETTSEHVWHFTKGDVKGTLTIKTDFTETDVFRARSNRDPQYGDEYYANSDYLTKWSDGTGVFSTDKVAWKKMKAEKAAEKFIDEYEDAVSAQADANDAVIARDKAMETPGDAAVKAAQKALDELKKAKNDAETLGTALGTLENIDELYINNAGNLTEYAADLADAKKIASAENIAALESAITEAEGKLAQAKAENAEKKAAADKAAAEEAAKKAAADKAAADADKNAAEKAAADAAVLAYTPAKTKVTGVKSSKKKATVSFNKVPKNVTGYQIAVTNKKTGEVKIVYAKKSSKKTIKKTVKGLKKNTKYSVKVRAYNAVGTMTYCAPWSKAKSFKTKK